jgi:2-phospho-L-lactate guanylyltransferase
VTPRILLPVRPFAEGKTRLAAVLSAAEREALNRRFFEHVLGVASQVGDCHVISRSEAVLEAAWAAGAETIVEAGDDLNGALAQASAVVGALSDEPVLALSCDLPFVTVDDLAALIAAGANSDAVAACDTAGRGTNALLLQRPGLIPFRYGPDSIAAHRGEAERAGLRFAIIARPGLAEDIDTPDQLAAMRARGLYPVSQPL